MQIRFVLLRSPLIVILVLVLLAVTPILVLHHVGKSGLDKDAPAGLTVGAPPAHVSEDQHDQQANRHSQKLIVSTRIHFQTSSETAVNLSPLRKLVQSSLGYADIVSIACDSAAHGGQLLSEVKKLAEEIGSRIHVVAVSDWGQFVPALNALVRHAAVQKATHILFQSVECTADGTVVKELLSHMDQNTLVAGAAFPDQHRFLSDSEVPLDGLTSPWNTLAIWSVSKLSKTGFLLVSEGILDGIAGGIEEVAVIAVHQQLDPQHSVAKLVQLCSAHHFTWNTTTFRDDPKRKAKHDAKMVSKRERAAAQTDALGGVQGVVSHISARNCGS